MTAKRTYRNLLAGLTALTLAAAPAWAHFQMILPTSDLVSDKDPATIRLDLLFTHPMEDGPVMEMGKPRQFGVLRHKRKTDLLASIKPHKIQGKTAYSAEYTISTPADYVFYLEPAPYWEPAEQKMIIHYTKVVVDAFGAEEGWDAMVGFPIEIEPLVRPYGLWSGNLFRGVVKYNGKPLPFAEIEVEYYNKGRRVLIPADPYVTQVIRADAQGVFSYAMPREGWWGFAALVDADRTMPDPDGKQVAAELSGLIWVHARDMRATGK